MAARLVSMAEWRAPSAMTTPRRFRALGGWSGVRITPMFGRWGYFTGDRLFACFPLREREHDLWIRLSADDQIRALREPGVRPHRRFGRRGWIELDVSGEA